MPVTFWAPTSATSMGFWQEIRTWFWLCGVLLSGALDSEDYFCSAHSCSQGVRCFPSSPGGIGLLPLTLNYATFQLALASCVCLDFIWWNYIKDFQLCVNEGYWCVVFLFVGCVLILFGLVLASLLGSQLTGELGSAHRPGGWKRWCRSRGIAARLAPPPLAPPPLARGGLVPESPLQNVLSVSWIALTGRDPPEFLLLSVLVICICSAACSVALSWGAYSQKVVPTTPHCPVLSEGPVPHLPFHSDRMACLFLVSVLVLVFGRAGVYDFWGCFQSTSFSFCWLFLQFVNISAPLSFLHPHSYFWFNFLFFPQLLTWDN